jgi:transposase
VGGIVEIDERYFGPRRVRGKRGRGAGRKIPVIGLLKRAGKVFAQIVPNCSKTELLRVVHGQVKGAATIHTDGWKAYDGLVWDGFKHHRVHHHENEFARGKCSQPGIDGSRLAVAQRGQPDFVAALAVGGLRAVDVLMGRFGKDDHFFR